jgi:large subunit ribosomal protein L23
MYNIIKPISSEKTTQILEEKNVLTFYVSLKATKTQLKKEFEERFKVKPEKVNVLIDSNRQKKAYFILPKDSDIMSVATKLGLM